jgi:hypothetical protein
VSECVTNHKFSQRSCAAGGFIDTALKLNIVGGETYKHEDMSRHVNRMTCTVCNIERATETFDVYLPDIYAEQIRYCFSGLSPRTYLAAPNKTADEHSITDYKIDESYSHVDEILVVTVYSVGADIEDVARRADERAKELNQKSVLVNLPLTDENITSSVDAFRKYGYFFGGVMPYWTPECDALLLQKLYGNSPDWDLIKLFGKKIKKIADMVKADMKTV